MAKNSERAGTARTQDIASADFPEIAELGPAVFFKASMVYLQGLLTWQKEVLGFLGDRMRKDATLEHKLTRGVNVFELMRVQQDWAATALKQYVNESVKLFSLANPGLFEAARSDRSSRAAEHRTGE